MKIWKFEKPEKFEILNGFDGEFKKNEKRNFELDWGEKSKKCWKIYNFENVFMILNKNNLKNKLFIKTFKNLKFWNVWAYAFFLKNENFEILKNQENVVYSLIPSLDAGSISPGKVKKNKKQIWKPLRKRKCKHIKNCL